MKRQKQQVSFIPQNISIISPPNDKITQQQCQKLQNAQNVFQKNILQITTDIQQRNFQTNKNNTNINQKEDYLINQIDNHVRQIFNLNDKQQQQKQYNRKRISFNQRQNANRHINFDKYDENLYNPYRRIQTQVIQQKQQFIQQEQQNYYNAIHSSNNRNYKNQQKLDQFIQQRIIRQTFPKQTILSRQTLVPIQAIQRQRIREETLHQGHIVSDQSKNQVEWLQNHYKSNINHLSTLTNDLIKQIQGLLIQNEKREVRKKIIQLEIQTNKLKISLRKSPQTKHINYSLDLKYNKINFIKVAKRVDTQLRQRCQQLQDYLNNAIDQFNQSQKYLQALQLYERQFSKKINYNFIAQNYKMNQQIQQQDCIMKKKKSIQHFILNKKQIEGYSSDKIIKLKQQSLIKNKLSNKYLHNTNKHKLKSLNFVGNQSNTSLGEQIKLSQNIKMQGENYNDYGYLVNPESKNKKNKKFYYNCQKQKQLEQNQTRSSKYILSIRSEHHQYNLNQKSKNLKQQILNIQVENNIQYKSLARQIQLLRQQLSNIEQNMITQYGFPLQVNCLTKKNQLKFAQVTFSGLENVFSLSRQTVKSPLKINKIHSSIASMKQIRPSKKLYAKIRTELNLIQDFKIRQSDQSNPQNQYGFNQQKQIIKRKQIRLFKSPLILRSNLDRSHSQRIINRFKKQKCLQRISFIPSNRMIEKQKSPQRISFISSNKMNEIDNIKARFQNMMEQNNSKIHSKETTVSHNDDLINQ